VKARSIVTLALLAGCNYDYSLIGEDPEIPKTVEEAGSDPVASAVPGGPAFPPVQTAPEEPEAPVDEGGPAEEEEPAPEPSDTADEPSYGYDTGEEPPPEEPPVEEPPAEEPPPEEPPVDTDVPPEEPPVDPPPPEDPPPPVEPPPPPPVDPTCSYQLPLTWEVQTRTGGYETMNSFVGDVDNDGYEDALWVNQGDANITVRWGSIDGLGSSSSTYSSGRSEGYVSVGDFDGDGRNDILISNQDAGRVRILKGGAGRTYTNHTAISVADFPQRVLFHDITGDGLLDIVVGEGFSNKTLVLPSSGVGSWGAPVNFLFGSQPLRAGDFDGDGEEELLQSYTMKLLGVDGLPWTQAILPDLPTGLQLHQAWPYDVDGDGDSDVIAYIGNELHAWESSGGELVHCDVTSFVPYSSGFIDPASVGDVNGDGLLDWTSQRGPAGVLSTHYVVLGKE